MAVQFILGSAGAGKSHKLYEIMTYRAFNNSDTEYVAIVPEQYSMESQKEIINIHPKHGAFNTEVVSFNRLALGVFEEMGLENVKVMDDLGKTLVLRRILEDCKKELKIYSGKIGMPGFVDKIKSTISELQQYNIDVKTLKRMIESSEKRPALKYKLNDICTIYEHFNDYIKDKMITQEEVLGVLCRYIDKSDKVKNSEYFIDGFTGFTPIQRNVVELLIRYAKNVIFAFTLPKQETEFDAVKQQELFALSKKTIMEIKAACVDNGVPVLNDIIIENEKVNGETRPYRLKESGELSHIEANIFRYSKTKVYDDKCKDVSLHMTGNPRKEALFVASKIAEMMIENDLRYRDIAVITGDMETYYRYLEESFNVYGIPAFIDHKRSITSNPFVDGIKAVIEIVEKDFSYESVFHYLRLGIFSDDLEGIDRFENYVLMSGRRGYNSYSREWDRQYKEVMEDELQKINELKKSFVDSIADLRGVLKNKNATVRERISALYEFVVSQNIQEKLENYADKFNEEGDLSRASEYRQTYGTIIELFDKVVGMLGDEILSLKEFKGILESGFESIKVGIIPPAVDSVMVGDIERTRLKDIKKVIFLIGANDGIIPKNNAGGGMISDLEREFLEESKFELAPTARENAFTQKLYLYAALTKPSNRLLISFSKSNAGGEEIRKSYIVSVVQKLFSQLNVCDEDNEDMQANILCEKDAYRYVAKALNDYRMGMIDDRFSQVYSCMFENEKSREVLLSMVDAAFYSRSDENLNEMVARMLYGIKDNVGITRLERFAACAYSQFVQNGLKLKQRRHFELAAYDLGNLYHNSIDLFCKEVQSRNIRWAEIDDTTRNKLVDFCVEKVISEYDNDVLSSSARNLYIADRVRKVTDKTVKVLGKHLAGGEFEPKYFELVVNHGRIDRVDVFEKDDRMYIKVIDYKSGNKIFSLEDTFYGLQLQLMVYLNDAIGKEQRENPDKLVLPGGAFYYGIKNPYVDKPDFANLIETLKENPEYSDLTGEELKAVISDEIQFKQFKMSGIVNENSEVLEAMDLKAAQERGTSDIIPLKYSQKGIDKRGSSVISCENFKAVLSYVKDKTDKIKEQILSGDISANPYDKSCTYCPYMSICKFDSSLGDRYREKEKMKADDILEKINAENEGR